MLKYKYNKLCEVLCAKERGEKRTKVKRHMHMG